MMRRFNRMRNFMLGVNVSLDLSIQTLSGVAIILKNCNWLYNLIHNLPTKDELYVGLVLQSPRSPHPDDL